MYLELRLDETDEQREIRDQAHRFAAEVLRPASLVLDKLEPGEVIEAGSPLRDVYARWYELGNHLLAFPEELGGANLGALEQHLLYEELGWGAADLSVSLAATTFPFSYAAGIARITGNQRLLDEIVMPYVENRDGTVIGCWAITEPAHGSDTLAVGTEAFRQPATAGQCRARIDGGDVVISGQKSSWVSNGTIATHACLYCTFDPSIGMAGGAVVVVPLDLPGVIKGKPWDKLGQRALNQGEIFFDDVRVPRDYMLTTPDHYTRTLERTLAMANAGMGAMFTGLARAAFEEALQQVKSRVQGGKPICEHQLVQSHLFEMFTRVEQARALSRLAYVYNHTSREPSVEHSIASKVSCTQAAFDVASRGVQLFGALGLSRGMLVEKLLRDARASMIEDGANDLLGLVAARRVIDTYKPE